MQVRRQLQALGVVVYAILPIDAIWVGYDVPRIMAGDPAPSVELAVHPIGPEGILLLPPLLGCDNQVIREGVRALLAEHLAQLEDRLANPAGQHWTAIQIAEVRLSMVLSGRAEPPGRAVTIRVVSTP